MDFLFYPLCCTFRSIGIQHQFFYPPSCFFAEPFNFVLCSISTTLILEIGCNILTTIQIPPSFTMLYRLYMMKRVPSPSHGFDHYFLSYGEINLIIHNHLLMYTFELTLTFNVAVGHAHQHKNFL